LSDAAPSVTRKSDADALILSLAGDWIIGQGARLEESALSLVPSKADTPHDAVLDLSGVERMDTAGAWAIDRARFELTEAGVPTAYRGARPEYDLLLKEAGYHAVKLAKHRHPNPITATLRAIGESVYVTGEDVIEWASFFGQIVAMTFRLLPHPRKWRWTSMSYHLENYSLRSVPIILLINLVVGAIVTQQGIFQLSRFGASAYAIDLVGVLGLREMGVLMTAIMIAGRTGSAITAEIGSMSMREEIDALRVMALDPLEVLIMPRLVALVFALPILTFIADGASLAGGMAVAWIYGGVGPPAFVSRLHEAIGVQTFAVGLIKAPFMAAMIGIIASIEGMGVHGSAESLGENVTASVVKSIFMVIVMDGLFAMFFAAVNY
jgi:phospholipid/cholesterol/gamma-HCH transport system permease protein